MKLTMGVRNLLLIWLIVTAQTQYICCRGKQAQCSTMMPMPKAMRSSISNENAFGMKSSCLMMPLKSSISKAQKSSCLRYEIFDFKSNQIHTEGKSNKFTATQAQCNHLNGMNFLCCYDDAFGIACRGQIKRYYGLRYYEIFDFKRRRQRQKIKNPTATKSKCKIAFKKSIYFHKNRKLVMAKILP